MKHMRRLLAGVVGLLMLFGSPAVGETIHVDQTLESMFLTLHLDADVENWEIGTPLIIYKTDYPLLDTENWAKMIHGDAANVQITENQIRIAQNDCYAVYWYEEARYGFGYSGRDYFRAWSYATEGKQATGLTTTPAEAQAIAQSWIDQLNTILGWDGYVFSACYTMPSEVEWDEHVGASGFQQKDDRDPMGCYVIEFVKMLGSYSVAYDHSPYFDMTNFVDTEGDHILLYIDDAGIGKIDGYCRSYEVSETATLQVTLDEAIEILQQNMDYAECYPEEMPCEITQISLCYRLVQMLPVSDEDAAVKMEARPTWRFASNINRWDQQTFFMFVDAVTGEVLP